jgi:hypothetical protein
MTMFDQLFKKKKIAINPPPNKNDEDSEESDIEAPEVDETIAGIEAAMKKADQIKKAEKKREREEAAEDERQRNRFGSVCGCG